MDQNKLQNYRYRPIILGVIIFVSMLLLVPLVMPDTKHRIATLEIFGLVLIPLFIFYARSNWSQRLRLRAVDFSGTPRSCRTKCIDRRGIPCVGMNSDL
jgi:hypothetical protein